jgi:hypothetical protein
MIFVRFGHLVHQEVCLLGEGELVEQNPYSDEDTFWSLTNNLSRVLEKLIK